jgi:uncharacterized membrane protein HdeD (DUF308 family)
MKERFKKVVHGEIISFIFYISFGLCLILMPTQTVNVICKVIFGLVLIGVGGYNIWQYAGEKAKSTILDLFSGVIVFVLGAFLFFNPQVVVKLLPFLLAAFILVDSIWTLRGGFRLYKRSRPEWKVLMIGGLLFIVLGIVLIVNPFVKVTHTVIFAGWVFLANGAVDLILFFLLKHAMKKADEAVQVVEATVEPEPSQIPDKGAEDVYTEAQAALKAPAVLKEEVSETPIHENDTFKQEAEVQETMKSQVSKSDIPETEIPEVEIPKAEIPKAEPSGKSLWDFDEDEILEEWKD